MKEAGLKDLHTLRYQLYNILSSKTKLQGQITHPWLLSAGGGEKSWLQSTRGILRGDRTFPHLNCGSGHMAKYICQNSQKLYAKTIYFYCV